MGIPPRSRKLKKICIITPGILSSNPRVVKEAEALSGAGFKVHIIYTRHVGYLLEQDINILTHHPEWRYDFLDWASPTFQARRLKSISGLRRRIAIAAFKCGFFSGRFNGRLMNRFYSRQLKAAVNQNADLYIAHYPDSIAVAAEAATMNKSLFAYDAEDYHRGENLPAWLSKAIASTEDHYLNQAAYISAASPMISEIYKKHFPALKVFSFENMFPLRKQPPFEELKSGTYKFFWFSQTIGPGRGLEEFITVLGMCKPSNFQLTLLGKVSNEYRNILQSLWSLNQLDNHQLTILATVDENDIFKIASQHHFGLCLEIPKVLNKDLCLSNKLYSYLLSGNYLILSNTRAQYRFHDSFPESGLKIDLEKPSEAAFRLLNFIEENDLSAKRRANFDLAKKQLNFDLEKEILIRHIRKL